jgi:L-amino acid N-acyltransferase YncA
MPFQIRPATEADLPGILEIYNDAVANTLAIFNETIVDLENRRDWLKLRSKQGYPVLVAVRDDLVLGYATYGDWRPFEGFRHSREHSIYVRSDVRGSGIGRALMIELIECAKSQNIHVLVAAIEASNEASIHLHASLGFIENGRFHEVGQKFGNWLDLVFMQLKVKGAPNLKIV